MQVQMSVPYKSWPDQRDTMYQILLAKRTESAGIFSIVPGKEHHDAARDMSSLPPQEQRRLKRKFRKAWRSAAKKSLQSAGNSKTARSTAVRHAERNLGLGSMKSPNKKQKYNRKLAVAAMLMHEAWAARNALLQG